MPGRLAIWFAAALVMGLAHAPAMAANVVAITPSTVARGGSGSFAVFTDTTVPFEAFTLDIATTPASIVLGTLTPGPLAADFSISGTSIISGFTIFGPVTGPGVLFVYGFTVPNDAPLGFTTIEVATDPSAVAAVGELQFFARGLFEVTASNLTNIPVPEPMTAALLAAGLLATGLRTRR